MKNKMSEFVKLFFLSIIIIAVYFMITGAFEKKGKNEIAVSVNNNQKVLQVDQSESIYSLTPQMVTYNQNNKMVWVKQRIFLSRGQIQPSSSYQDETIVYLYFLNDDDQIISIDLTAYALKYNLYEGIHYIAASPSGRYIVAEFLSDVPISILIDTEDKTSRVLWYDEPKLISMMSISWNPNEENEFAFLPSVDIKGENGSHSVKIYNLNTQSSKNIGYIDMERISLQKTIIQWSNHKIKLIPTNNDVVTVFNFDINE